MLYFEPYLHLQCASLCNIDTERFRKFLSSTKVFASGAALFATVVLPEPTQHFIIFCIELRGNKRTKSSLLEFLCEHAKQQAVSVPSRWYTVLQKEAKTMYLLLHLRMDDPTKGIMAVLHKLEQLEKLLDAVALDHDANRQQQRVPPLCFKDFGALMEKDHKSHLVCRMLLLFKAVLEGRPADGRMPESVPEWKAADLQGELFVSPEKSHNTTKWTAAAWLEAITAPIDGVEGSGDAPMSAILSNYIEGCGAS